jgi:hypothetical protein
MVSWLLIIVITTRYGGDATLRGRHLAIARIATLLLAASGALAAFRGAGRRFWEEARGDSPGILIGLMTGIIWILEIRFNNFATLAFQLARSGFISTTARGRW